MNNAINLDDLKDRIFKCNKEAGFHDKDLGNVTYVMLIITELSEAVNADRKGNYASQKISSTSRYTSFPTSENRFKKEFNAFIKDTVEDELADAVIRILDLCARRNVNISLSEHQISWRVLCITKESFIESVYFNIKPLTNPYFILDGANVVSILENIFAIAYSRNIDLLWHIEQKVRYNEATLKDKKSKKLEVWLRLINYSINYKHLKEKVMKKKIENFIARCVCKGIEMYMRKYCIYISHEELIPMSDEEFREELTKSNTDAFCEMYFERYDKYRKKS